MVLKRVEIQGFKSFPDKIKIPFNQGVTAIVGPNGSGKSNISDAIRWVLGETSSKQLRGSGKMEDVIFGGTQSRNAMGYANVALILDNSDHRLDLEAEEVSIGRRYYRSGESEYYINGNKVRLKDIYELFLDTGLGKDGYSIIGQGKIAEIVASKSNERREIFEEASGISKYRYRKNEAERRLASTEDNLVRLRDILLELEARVGPLEKESDKAKKYLELNEIKQGLDITLWIDIINRAKETVRNEQRKMEIAQSDYDRDISLIEQIESEMEILHNQDERLIMDMENYSKEILQINEEMSQNDEQIAVLKNDISHNEQSIFSIQEEINQTSGAKNELLETVNKREQDIKNCEEELNAIQQNIISTQKLLQDIIENNEQSGEKYNNLSSTLAQTTENITQLKVEVAFAQSTIGNNKSRLETAVAEKNSAFSKKENLEKSENETKDYLKSIDDETTKLNNIKDGTNFKLENRNEQKNKLDLKANDIRRNLENSTQKINVLKDLEKNMEGYQSSVKYIIKSANEHRIRGIIGTVASLINVKSGYEVAIETAIGFALQNIVVQDDTSAKMAMELLKKENRGRATFLPLNTVKGRSLDASLSGSAKCASTLVNYDEKYKNIISSILGAIVIVDDINEGTFIAKKNNFRFKIVTKDGQVINAGGSFTGGSISKSAGMFSRKQEIEDLKSKIINYSENLNSANEECQKIKSEIDTLTADITAIESELITLNGDKIRANVELESITLQLNDQMSIYENLEQECNNINNSLVENETKITDGTKKLELLNNEISMLEQEISVMQGSNDNFLKNRTKISDDLSELKLKELTINNNISMYKQEIDNINNRTDEAEERRQLQKGNIDKLQLLISQNNEKITILENDKQKYSDKIKDVNTSIEKARSDRLSKEKLVNDKKLESKNLNNHKEDLSKEIARLSERKIATEVEYDQTVAKLWEEYNLTTAQATDKCVEFENTTELKRRVSEVRAKIKGLGNVNVNAIEEFIEVNERYTFMNTQVNDVEKAKNEILRLISELSEEMKDIFSEKFDNINENFTRIFAELFGGGTAKLSLSEPDNLLESGIDIEASPPGKVVKNLSSLSGGEQSLIAISIYFAILAVNPAPFCVLDEIEAALDDVNVVRYADYLHRISNHTQFIVITHRRGTMESADVLYGVTMQEKGISKLIKLDVNDVDVNILS